MRLKTILYTGLLLLTACSTGQDQVPGEQAAIPVLATQPQIKDVPVYIEAVGILRASVNMEVRPQVSGTITEVLVNEGDWVKPGMPLFKIDAATYEIKLQEALAKLEMDKAALSAAQRKLERFRSLADKDLISQSDWDELETSAEKASATVEADKASVNAARLDLSYCTLTSCVEGRLGRLDVHHGLLVSTGQAAPLASIAKMDPLVIEFSLTEKESALLAGGRSEIEILSIAAPEKIGSGEITFLDNHYDSRSGLLMVRGKVPNAGAALRPGQSVRVRIPVNVIAEAKLIPQKAVKYNQEGPYLYVVGDGNVVVMRKVHLGPIQDKDVIVLEGLAPDEHVITDGHMRIYPGSKVEVKE